MIETRMAILNGFRLSEDFQDEVGFMALVNDQIRKLRVTGRFLPPRFFGYYFVGEAPIGVAGSWTVVLDPVEPIISLPPLLREVTDGRYCMVSPGKDVDPFHILVHDRYDGACSIWPFSDGQRFIEASEPTYT
jgi:hypothetical protein